MESSARGHASPPLLVTQIDPSEEHPGLGPIRRLKRAVNKGKVKTKKSVVKVEVTVKHGGSDETPTDN